MKFFVLLPVLLLLATPLTAQDLPPDFYDEAVFGEFHYPYGITFDEVGNGYIWEKTGRVYIIDADGNRLPNLLISVNEELTFWKDHGLNSLALDPNFRNNGYLYLFYVVDTHYYENFGTASYDPDKTILNVPTFGRITRFTADPATGFTTIIPGSRKVLLGHDHTDGIPIIYQYHGLGSIIFGTDGTLLVSSGDTASPAGADIGGNQYGTMATEALESGILTPDQDIGAYRSQYLGNLNGKVLRIDPDTGEGLPSNPFYDPANPRSPASRTWALGFRNPYRIVLQPNTGAHDPNQGQPGRIMVGDVGNVKWEELNVVTEGGQNFGWPLYEGITPMADFWNKETPENQLAPNPLHNQLDCELPFFNFKHLIHPPIRDGQLPHLNPCDSSLLIPEALHPMVVQPPLITWNNNRTNSLHRTYIPAFEAGGALIGIPIEHESSGVEGNRFDGFSSLAGVFYDQTTYPPEYQGQYFGVDFMGWIRLFEFDENGKLLRVAPFHDECPDIIHLALNPKDGLLYYVSNDKTIHRIGYGGSRHPTAVIEADPDYGPTPLSVTFDANASTGYEQPITAYEWYFEDGSVQTGAQSNFTFYRQRRRTGQSTVRLKVTTAEGKTATTEKVIALNNTPPKAAITSFEDGARYPMGKTSLVMLHAAVSDRESPTEELDYQWEVRVHHNAHFHSEASIHTPTTYMLVSPLGCDAGDYAYEAKLTVTDPEGLKVTDSHWVYPHCEGPLVVWDSLRAIPTRHQIDLEWEILSQTGLDRFEIQRGSDFFDFSTINGGRIETYDRGNFQFGFSDRHPRRGVNIYRIKAYGEDGAFAYTNPVAVNYPLAGDLLVYPNPTRGTLKLEMTPSSGGPITYSIYNSQGQLLLQRSLMTVAGDGFSKEIDVGNLPAGSYFLQVTHPAGDWVERIEVVP